MRRPTSVKWACAITLLMSLVWMFANGWDIAQHGWEPTLRWYGENPLQIVEGLIWVLALVFVFGGRRKLAYWTGAVVLLGTSCRIVTWKYVYREDGSHDVAATALLTALTGYLVWRFTFGKPSRRYYRMMEGTK